ncbi:NAD-dependent epimerase/dehydratase family protein [bacterium]|nr:NAD-dependent epimerase/dehydratase family protein [bacterium]
MILVTGATGFIGQHLCRFLLTKGSKIRGVCRNSKFFADETPEIEWVQIPEIGPETNWSEALDGVEYVVHLAALAHQMGIKADGRTAEFMRTNALGTHRLAEAIAKTEHISRLLFLSSIGAVKSFSEEVVSEQTQCQPDTEYGQSKLAAETVIKTVLNKSKSDWTIIRPVLVYGPGNPGNMARLLKLVKIGLPLPLGSIENRRSFVFVGNLVDAVTKALTHPSASRKTFLVSDGEDVSTPQLIRILSEQAGLPARLIPLPVEMLKLLGKAGDTLERILGIPTGMDSYSIDRLIGSLTVDSTAIINELGWFPPYTLAEGLKVTFRDQET